TRGDAYSGFLPESSSCLSEPSPGWSPKSGSMKDGVIGASSALGDAPEPISPGLGASASSGTASVVVGGAAGPGSSVPGDSASSVTGSGSASASVGSVAFSGDTKSSSKYSSTSSIRPPESWAYRSAASVSPSSSNAIALPNQSSAASRCPAS